MSATCSSTRASSSGSTAKRGASRLRSLALALALLGLAAPALAAGDERRVELEFFWAEGCPHCHEAQRFLDALVLELPWLDVTAFELRRHPEHRERYARAAERLGQAARFVPAFLFCDTLLVGYAGDDATGAALRAGLLRCRAGGGAAPPQPEAAVEVPILGRFDPGERSLALLTLVIAGLDAFNPCAFFVLLFLLSLLVHARSRARIFLVGGVFVAFSGLLYFLFMAAWLNAFLLLPELRAVTAVAGAVAVVIAALNIKDYFWFRRGVSLSIPDRAKPGLFRRMRRLALAASLPSMLLGTVLLALAANAYELLCTAGFPLVFTRILTLSELPTGSYYLYLALYNVIYVIPLAVVVAVFAWTLGSRKLSEVEGRVLKLLSGNMMLCLGVLLLVAPDGLQSIPVALGALGAAIAATGLVVWIDRRLHPEPA